jgi:D-alanine-D-alanine ligase
MKKIKVAVLFGGQSTEHDVSCLSAVSVIKNTDREKFEVNAVGITKDGVWCPIGDRADMISGGEWRQEAEKYKGMSAGLEAVSECDVVFPVMHGIMAEDGTIQGVLELLRKPYVGCGVLADAVCMDKVYTKIVLENAGIPQAECVYVTRLEIEECLDEKVSLCGEKLGYPCFVKPSNSGSSVGVYKASSPEELAVALKAASKYDRKVLVEEFIDGAEIECAVLGNEKPQASTPGEILPSKEFYDYEDKYLSGTSAVRIPAKITEEQKETVRTLAVKAFKALDCAGLSRVDFFLEKGTGRILLNEINTLPGFTEISMYSKMWAYDGVDFKTLVTRLIDLAFENFERNKRII